MIEKMHSQSTIRKLYAQPSIRMTTSLILSIVVSMIFFVFAIRPTVLTITNLKKQLKDEQQVLSLIKQKVQALQMAEGTYYQAQPYFTYLDRAIPQDPEIALFNTQLAYLAGKHNIQLNSAVFNSFNLIDNQPAEDKRQEESKEIDLTLAFTASWQQTQAILSDLENLERLISIEIVSQSAGKNAEENLINTTLQGKIYYFPQN